MKIAFLVPDRKYLGPVIFTKILVAALNQENVFVRVFYLRNSADEVDFCVPAMKLSLSNFTELNHFDIIHTTSVLPDLVGLIYGLCFRRMDRVVVGVHNFFWDDVPLFYRKFKAFFIVRMWSFVFMSARNTIFSTKHMCNEYRRYLDVRCRAVVIPYGIPNFSDDQPQYDEVDQIISKFKGDSFTIVSVGKLILRKNFHVLIESLAFLSKAKLVIIGDGALLDELRDRAISIGVDDRILFLGFIKDSHRYLHHFDCYAISSFSEGFGLSLLEALRYGLPAVVSDIDIYRGSEFSGLQRFSPTSAEELSSRLSDVCRDPAKHSIISRSLYLHNFSVEAMALKHIDFYKEICDA